MIKSPKPIDTTMHFYAIGISYKKADAQVRGYFSIDATAQEAILDQAKAEGIPALTVISTCNRTELYGFANDASQLIKILCEHTRGTIEDFKKVAYTFEGKKAIHHLFQVGTGLDSQILGDFEIIGQLKVGFKNAKKIGLANPFMERLINSVITASKRIKTETEISTGATSVSFAAVQYILAHVPYVSEKNILLFGTGKIGRNTCENLIKHTQNKHITLVNRTKEKAEKIAGKFNLTVKEYANIQSEITQTDVLVVATGAQKPTINKSILYTKKPLLILDLSVPKNVSEDVLENEHITLVHMDALSKMTDATLERRKLQVPRAQQIIKEVITEFDAWQKTRKFAPTIKALKIKLHDIKTIEINQQSKKRADFDEDQAEIISNRIIRKITNQVALHLKDEEGNTEESLALLKKVFQL